MKKKKIHSQLGEFFKRQVGFRSKRCWSERTLLKAAGEAETAQGISKTGFSWMKQTLDFCL
jgi:hypothetical protein